MKLQRLTITVRRGSAEAIPIRIESSEWRYASITNIAQSAPVGITAPAHGIPDNWRGAVMNVRGPTVLNAENNPPTDRELRVMRRVDADTLEINDLNGAGLRPYVSGGQIAFRAPLDLSQYIAARMNVRDKVGGALLANYTTDSGRLEIDPGNEALWLRLQEDDTLALTRPSNVFDIELIRGNGDPDRVCAADSVLTVLPETTTE